MPIPKPKMPWPIVLKVRPKWPWSNETADGSAPESQAMVQACTATAKAGGDQRVGEADDLTNGQETGACDLPEECLWEVSREKVCQRMVVLSSAPKRVESSRTRRGDGPCRMALIRITMAAK